MRGRRRWPPRMAGAAVRRPSAVALPWAARSNSPATLDAGTQGPSPFRTSVSGPILPSRGLWTSSGAETGPNSVPITLKYHSAAIVVLNLGSWGGRRVGLVGSAVQPNHDPPISHALATPSEERSVVIREPWEVAGAW